MTVNQNLIFIHGLMGSSQGNKATLLRGLFPGILTPDFSGSLDERMQGLRTILGDESDWTMIGSSFGGLMAAIFTCQRPQQVEKLVLLAPALIWPEFASNPPDPVDVPVTIYHGSRDEVIPIEAARALAEQVFRKLSFNVVDDDHGLHKTIHELDWPVLLGVKPGN
jgi:pimeloyl-ACP methyl ester carboxylesterase